MMAMDLGFSDRGTVKDRKWGEMSVRSLDWATNFFLHCMG